MRIVIVDYGVGNVQSIINAIYQFNNVKVILSSNANEILDADGLILPGVGAFKKAMEELSKRNLPNVLHEYLLKNKPILGICLGMQLLFESSEEFGHSKGLGFIKGRIESFPNDFNDKLPHVSWNSVIKQKIDWNGTIFKGIREGCDFYFVHSYICKPEDPNIIITKTEYGGVYFCSSIQYNNIYACQFHPEKSSTSGLNILKNFINIVGNSK